MPEDRDETQDSGAEDQQANGADENGTGDGAANANAALEQLTLERDRLKDQLIRTLADFDNFRKRARKDIDEASRRGTEEVVKALLPVFDNLERAAQFAATGADPKAIGEGVQMTLRLFESTVEKLGAKRLRAVGLPFDPSLHEAIQQVESAEFPAGTIVSEMAPGYTLGDRLIRPAMVAVSKGPKPSA